jgi:hypothetical protein
VRSRQDDLPDVTVTGDQARALRRPGSDIFIQMFTGGQFGTGRMAGLALVRNPDPSADRRRL